MLDEADRDGDGEISVDELMNILKKTNLFWTFSFFTKINNYYILRNIINKLNTY